ncbi:unnamed protein product [Aphis gossypii]|uniref:Uncharacterized protein n=1 Tax=Aphis gossypii TaxID=80765 RepID=A0A9P0IWD2_APHGO|nr:unnamed protein product [Aphis gossypii]
MPLTDESGNIAVGCMHFLQPATASPALHCIADIRSPATYPNLHHCCRPRVPVIRVDAQHPVIRAVVRQSRPSRRRPNLTSRSGPSRYKCRSAPQSVYDTIRPPKKHDREKPDINNILTYTAVHDYALSVSFLPFVVHLSERSSSLTSL